MAILRASFPEIPAEWATNGGTQIKPTAGEFLTGFEPDDVVPARYLNYLLDMANKWVKPTIAATIGNYSVPVMPTVAVYNNIFWHPYQSLWCTTLGSTGATYYSSNGIYWQAGATVGAAVHDRSRSVDNANRPILGGTGGQVYYKANGDVTATTFATAAAVGWAGNTVKTRIRTGTNNVMAFTTDALGLAYIADITGGSWSVRTGSLPATLEDMIHVSGTIWEGLKADGTLYDTATDGASWTTMTSPDASTFAARSMDIEPTTGRITIIGSDTGTNYLKIYYTDDYGVSWSSNVAPSVLLFAASTQHLTIRNIGGTVWVAAGYYGTLGAAGSTWGCWYSIDNAETWFVAQPTIEQVITRTYMVDIDYNGSYWLAAGDTNGLKGLNHQYD